MTRPEAGTRSRRALWWALALLVAIGVGKWVVVQSGLVLGAVVEKGLARAGRLEPPAWRAARALPANHRLRPEDLRPPDPPSDAALPEVETLTGRYLAVARDEGEPVAAALVRPLPDLTPAEPGRIAVVVALSTAEAVLAEVLEVGSRLELCAELPAAGAGAAAAAAPAAGAGSGWTCLAPDLPVAAVHPGADGDGAWLALEAPAADGAELARYLAAERRSLTLLAPRSEAAPAAAATDAP